MSRWTLAIACAFAAGSAGAADFAVARAADDAPPAPAAAASDGAKVPADEKAALFAWFDGLAYPGVVGGRPVRVTRWGRDATGFLLEDDGTRFRAFVVADLDEFAGDRSADTKRSTPPDACEPTDLAVAAQEELADVRRRYAGDAAAPETYTLCSRARLFVLARACAARGMDALADDLLAECARIPGIADWYETDARKPLRERVEGDLEFREQSLTWTRAAAPAAWRAAFETYLRRFPDAERAAEAEQQVRVLRRMEAEEASLPTEADIEKLEPDAQVAAWILRLRVLRGAGVAVNGGPASIFAVEWGGRPEAADRLLALGQAAIPRLVEATTDDTLTRVTYEGRNGFHPGVVTVGACAADVLRHLAADSATPSGAHVWWMTKHATADDAALLRRVAAGGPENLDAAKALVAARPADSVWPVEAGLCTSGYDASKLDEAIPWYDLYASLPDPRVPQFLAVAARAGRLTHKVAAIAALERHDAAASLAAARRLLRFLPDESHVGPNETISRRDLALLCRAENAAAVRLVRFLVAHRESALLADRFGRQQPCVRLWTAREVATSASDVLSTGVPATGGKRAGPTPAESLLLAALADGAVVPGTYDVAPGVSLAAPRVRDAAAASLAARFAADFRFDAMADAASRDAACAEAAATLRRRTSP